MCVCQSVARTLPFAFTPKLAALEVCCLHQSPPFFLPPSTTFTFYQPHTAPALRADVSPTMSRVTQSRAQTEANAKLLRSLVKHPDNKVCVDCKKNDPRWASWNIGCFLCIRCSGIHRSMGTHISKGMHPPPYRPHAHHLLLLFTDIVTLL